MHPLLAPLARRAWAGLAIAVSTASAAYALSYVRSLKQIVEEPDIVPGGRRWIWLPPFGNRVQTAIGQFAVRTLARSRQHRMILAFYLGIGLALTIFQVKTPVRPPGSGAVNVAGEADGPLIAATIVMMALLVVGTRIVFALPLDLRANWVFRIAGVRWGAKAMAATRRAMLLLTVAPLWILSAALCLHYWPWRQAAGHLALLALMGVLLAELCLARFSKIPFTCSYLPGKSGVHMVFLYSLGLFYIVTFCTKYEQWALGNGRGIALMLALFGGALVLVRGATALLARGAAEDLRFEEEADPAVQELGLSR